MFKNAMVLIVLSALIGSTTPPFAKYALDGLGPFTLLLIRFISAKTVLWFIAPKQERNIETWNKLKFTSLFGAGNPLLFFVSLTATPASITPLFFAANPSLTAIHAKLFRKGHISRKQLAGILTGLGGVGLITFATLENNIDVKWWGILLLSLAVLSFTAYAVTSNDHLKNKHASPMTIVLFFSLMGALISFPLALVEHMRGEAILEGITILHVLSGVFTGAIGTGLGYLFYQNAMKMSDALTASIFFYIQPVFSILIALALLKETFGPLSIIGAAVVLIGAELARQKKPKLQVPVAE
jgi:drug/metabolite transporter (DMT)-like permease